MERANTINAQTRQFRLFPSLHSATYALHHGAGPSQVVRVIVLAVAGLGTRMIPVIKSLYRTCKGVGFERRTRGVNTFVMSNGLCKGDVYGQGIISCPMRRSA